MKKVIVAAALLGLLASVLLLGACGEKVPAGAIASVGDSTVTQQQFDQIWAQAKAQYASQAGAPAFPKEGTTQYDQLKASIVNYLVQNSVIEQEAAKMKISVTPKELSDRIAQITQQVGGKKKLDALLKKQGVTMEQLDAQLKAQMLQEKVKAKVGEAVNITDAQAQKYFNDPANKSQFVVQDTVDARHVLVKTKAEADKVYQLLSTNNTDANWKKVAKQYSIDPGTKAIGGELGSFTKDRMVKAFSDAAFALKVGQVSKPVKTQYGWHVIGVTKKTPGSTQTFAQAKANIVAQLKYQQQTTVWNDWLKKVQSELGIAYAAGFNPVSLTASPSPSATPASTPSSSTSATP